MDDIINNMRPAVKRAGLPDTRDNCWDMFINAVRDNLHVILCFSPIGDPIKIRTRRFPALVNCVVIDWFQPWPEEALTSVSKRFLGEVDLGDDQSKENIMNFMPYSFLQVNKISELYESQERRFNYTTPKSFLELIALYKKMLQTFRDKIEVNIKKLSDGVIKLESTAESVSGLEEEIKIKAVEVEAKKAEVEAMIPKLEEEKAKGVEEAAKANVIAAAATKKETEVVAMKAGIETKLAAAEPALVAASAALDSLNVKDLGELKSLKKPPAGVDLVTAATICLMQTKDAPFKKLDTSWKAAQQMMTPPPKFLDLMMGFKQKIDDGLVPKSNFQNIQHLLVEPDFDVDIQRKKSNAAAGLTDFIININIYNDINENVEPMRLGAIQANNELEAAIASKDAALAAKKQAEDTVAELTRQFNAATAEKEAVIADAERYERKLGLAQRLMAALGSEGARWKQSIITLNENMAILVGDVLLAAAFVSYIGCFNKKFRLELMNKTFNPYLKGELPICKGAIPMSEGCDPVKILTTEAQIAGWNSEQLPADRVSTENGSIVSSCARWPLMIDPQLQGIVWIKKHEEKRGLKVVRLGQKTLMQQLANGIENGIPVMIENIQLQVDAVLNPVIGRQTIKRGRNLVVKLGDKEVDYSPKFKLYLQTKLSNPHYPPEIQAETTLVNFMVTEDGLEDQLLAKVVQLERPDLASKKEELIQQQNNFKIKLVELEDGILEQLANAEGDVTENIALIENLEDSKATSIEVAEKMIIAKETEVIIEVASERYRPVANRGSLMFFLLGDLFKVHTFHFYSLNSFTLVYQRSVVGRLMPGDEWNEKEGVMKKVVPSYKNDKIKEAEEAARAEAGEEGGGGDKVDEGELKARLEYLVLNCTYEVFNYARRGLFDKHKLIVATMLVLRVMARKNDAPGDQIEYLVSGRRVPNPPNMTAKVQECLTEVQWGGVCALKEVEPFKTLHEDMELYVDSWKEWIEDPVPEAADLPGDWLKKTSPFAKLLLVRALRPDRMTAALTAFIIEYLGSQFMVQQPFDLEDTFLDSSSQTPLFFVLFPGVDPGTEIEALGKKLGFTEEKGNFGSISMGQGQEKNGENVLDRFTREGGWAFLQNVHLMQGWLPMLERKLEIAQEVGHEDFRCFVTAEPPGLPDQMLIPEGIMQASIKVANEPPTDVKSLLRGAYALFSQETLDKSTKPVQHRPMLFALSFFHAIALGRRKFGMQGFSRAYAWNSGDLEVCGAILHNYLEDNVDTPWADVRYLFGEVMYGGHITDPFDRRITSTYLEVMLNPDLVEEKSDFQMAPGLKPLLEGNYTDYRNYIEDASPPETPLQFGMHPNAEISLLNSLCENLFMTIMSIGGGGGGGGGQSKEEKVSAIQVSILESLRESFVMLEIRNRIKDKGAPYVVFLLGELERMNKILEAMFAQLNELALGLSGALNISDSMDALITAMFMNQVPPNWLKTCGQIGPTGTYNRKNLTSWYVDLQARWAQLEVWSAATKPVEQLPPSVWIAGCFNPMGFVTATLQVTARADKLSLDQMRVHIEVSDVYDTSTVEGQPDSGANIHGFFMENSRWDCEAPGSKDSLELAGVVPTNEVACGAGSVVDSRPKELYPAMPMLHLTGRTVDTCIPEDRVTEGRFSCAFYTTTIRGPTFVFSGPLRTNVDAKKWIICGSSLVMQPD
jgi:dynein heavy chain